jgi:hypothetical protein
METMMIIRREDFGKLNDIKPSSHKKIWFICENCGCGVLRQYNVYLRSEKRCLSCKSKHNNEKNKEKLSRRLKDWWSISDKHDISKKISDGQKRSWSDNPNRKSKPTVPYIKIKHEFESVGYIVLTKKDDYISASKTKIKFRCGRGHIHSMLYSKLISGQRCGMCRPNKKLNITVIEDAFKERGFRLLSDTYNNAHEPLSYMCPHGHIGKINYDNFLKGHGCAQCANNLKIEIDLESIRNMLGCHYDILGGKLWYTSKDRVKIRCKHNHISNINVKNLIHGSRCKTCYDNYASYEERNIANYITFLGVDIETNNRNLIYPYEIDIYMYLQSIWP